MHLLHSTSDSQTGEWLSNNRVSYADLRHDVVTHDSHMFHMKVRELIEKNDDCLPRGFMQRFGPDPFFEFAFAGIHQRNTMMRAARSGLGEDIPSHEELFEEACRNAQIALNPITLPIQKQYASVIRKASV